MNKNQLFRLLPRATISFIFSDKKATLMYMANQGNVTAPGSRDLYAATGVCKWPGGCI